MAFSQLKERMREHQAEMKRRSEQRKDKRELRRNQQLKVDLEPVLAPRPSHGSRSGGGTNSNNSPIAAKAVSWNDYKDALQRFYDDRVTFASAIGVVDEEDLDLLQDGGGDDAHSEVPEEFRRHLSQQADLSQLPEEFFQTAGANSFDVLEYVLDNLPKEVDDNTLISYIQSQIEKNDLFRDRVRADLTAVVMEKYDTFVAGMQTVKDIDMDLSTADVYATNSRRLLAQFKENLVSSTLRVVQRQRQRQRLVVVHNMVKVLERGQSLRSTMQAAIRDRRFAGTFR